MSEVATIADGALGIYHQLHTTFRIGSLILGVSSLDATLGILLFLRSSQKDVICGSRLVGAWLTWRS